MTTNTTTSTRRVAAGVVAKHDCAERGCLAAMLGLALDDATESDAEEGSSSSATRTRWHHSGISRRARTAVVCAVIFIRRPG